MGPPMDWWEKPVSTGTRPSSRTLSMMALYSLIVVLMFAPCHASMTPFSMIT